MWHLLLTLQYKFKTYQVGIIMRICFPQHNSISALLMATHLISKAALELVTVILQSLYQPVNKSPPLSSEELTLNNN